jgi:hypothetical protein
MEVIRDLKNTEVSNGHAASVEDVVVGGWTFHYSSREHPFPMAAQFKARELLAAWGQHFPKEDTWVQRNYGVPSLLVRLDATFHNQEMEIYEVEERPSGIGLSRALNPSFRAKLDQMCQKWPDFKVVISDDPRRKGTDDFLWAEVERPENLNGDLALVRAEPDETAYHHLAAKSVSSLQTKGDKSYGEAMGLWDRIEDPDQLPWEEPFTIKPLQGSKTRDVYIWLPNDLSRDYRVAGSKSVPGSFTRGKITQALLEAQPKGGMYRQRFYPPMESGLGDEYKWMIHRVFYGYDPETDNWECMGGLWNARTNLKIHGATDAACGPIKVI